METKKWLAYAHAEESRLLVHEDRNIFDNRFEQTDSTGPLPPLEFSTTPSERHEYHVEKFKFLSALLTSADEASTAAPSQVGDMWRQRAADEAKVYILRYLQGPSDAVHRTWYSEDPTFLGWASKLMSILTADPHGSLAESLKLPVCLEEELEIHSALLDLSHGARELAAGTGVGEIVLRVESSLAWRDRAYNLISAEFGALEHVLTQGVADFRGAMRVFLEVLRDTYEVEVCDYLEVQGASEAADSLYLDFVATTHDGDLDLVRRGEPAYGYAGGITGSAFLHLPEAAGRALLTNRLEWDPRQSPDHAALYENVYGDVRDFCIVPVFESRSLRGVIRLVNRVSKPDSRQCCEGRRGVWPLAVRVELTSLAAWLSGPIRTLRAALHGASDPSFSEMAHSSSWLAWAPPLFKADLLRDLAQIATMRDEHRSVSVTVVTAPRGVCEALEGPRGFRRYVALEDSRGVLLDAANLFNRILPGAGVFVCDAEQALEPAAGRCAYRSVLNTRQLSPAAAASAVARFGESAVFHVNGGRAVVHVFESGAWSADYFFDEKEGRWRLRIKEGISQRVAGMAELAGMDPDVFDALVYDRLIPYSYLGFGGLVAIHHESLRDITAQRGFNVGKNLQDMDFDEFARVLAVDGGVWIRPTGQVETAGLIFGGSTSTNAPGGGARHQAAQLLTGRLQKGIVFVVSANRPIRIFCSGYEPVLV